MLVLNATCTSNTNQDLYLDHSFVFFATKINPLSICNPPASVCARERCRFRSFTRPNGGICVLSASCRQFRRQAFEISSLKYIGESRWVEYTVLTSLRSEERRVEKECKCEAIGINSMIRIAL